MSPEFEFVCPIDGCDRSFSTHGGMLRHAGRVHEEDIL